jgi:hypothetical protein
MNKGIFISLFRKNLALLLCLLVQPYLFLAAFANTSSDVFSSSTTNSSLTADAAQAADILGIRQEAEQIITLRNHGINTEGELQQLNAYRAVVLRKIFRAVIQVQSAKSRLEAEQAYSYDVLTRTERKISTVNQFFNIFNFLQFGVLYTIEPYSRIHKQFKQSAICTSVGAGLGITLPLLCIIYNKFAKGSNLTPPAFLSGFIDGDPVNGSNMPPLIQKYLDQVPLGSNMTRRDALNAIWKERYHADLTKASTLCGINDGKSKSPFVLNSRIILLWSLYTCVQGFNKDLLSLLKQVRDSSFESSTNRNIATGLKGGAAEAARLLKLESVVAELKSLQSSEDSPRKVELQITFLETLIYGFLELQNAADKCQEELNYQIDVVLARMMARRGKFLQKTYEMNFIQTGVLGACAGWSYLNGYTKAGNELFIIANSIGIGLSTVSTLALHGGWRRNQSGPNSLAGFFHLRTADNYAFSNLVWDYLNSASPDRSDGKTRRDYLHEIWSTRAVATMNLKDKRNLEKLGSMPSCKWDTMKIVVNRIALLSSLQEELDQFDAELLDLLRAAWPETVASSSENLQVPLDPYAAAGAKLIGVQREVEKATAQNSDEKAKMIITRKVLEGFLDINANADIIEFEILVESQVMNRMIRQRDMAIQLTNIINFYQIGILGVISDSLGLSSSSYAVLVGNRINIISGLMISCLALTALLERRGGPRLNKAKPNVLYNAFGKQSNYINLSPLMVKYLNTPRPDSNTSMTKREELIKYWKEAKILNVNVKRESVVQKLSAQGRAHHWWNETINLINNRITMLYDLRATLRTSYLQLGHLMQSIN